MVLKTDTWNNPHRWVGVWSLSSSGSDQVSEVHVPHGNRPAQLNRAIFPGFKETFTLQGKHIFFLNQIFFQADLTAVIELDCDAQTLPIYMAYPGNDDGESELVGIQEGKEKKIRLHLVFQCVTIAATEG